MKIDFNLNISHIIIVALCIGLFISILSKPTGISKGDTEKLFGYYQRQAKNIGIREHEQIMKRMEEFETINRRLYKSMVRQDLNTKKLNDIDKHLKKLEYAVENPKNYYILPVDSIDDFWSKRLGSNR